MRILVGGLAAIVRRAPWAVVAVVVAGTALLGPLAGSIELATGNEGFAPEGEEIAAGERIADKFGRDSSETALQVIVRREGGDVITVDGLRAVTAAVEAIRSSEVGDNLADRPDRPGVLHYLIGVEQAMDEASIPMESMTDELVKQLYVESMQGDPGDPESAQQSSFLSGLASQDLDQGRASASAGMVLAFVGTFEGAGGEESFNRQVEAESALADELALIDEGVEIRPFSFGLLVSGFEEFNEEVGQLFALAFAVILAILLIVYWLWPGEQGSWLASIRRTTTDTVLTLVTIVVAIVWMQGLGYLLFLVGAIEAFSPPTQIVPILLIGLGVDYAIHLTSRYREHAGKGRGVDTSVRNSVTTVGIALALATITTVIGFLTNLFNPIPALRDFGILAAVGIVVAFVLMLTFVPSMRTLLDRRAERKGTIPVRSLESHGDRLLPRVMEKLALVAKHAPVPTLALALLLGGAGLYGFTQLETRFSFTDFLPDDSVYLETMDILAEDFGGGFGEQSQVLVESTGDRGIDGEVHNALVQANADLASAPDVSTIDDPQGTFVNAASPIALLGQLLAGGEQAPPQVRLAAEDVGLAPDLTVPPGTDVTPLYQAMVTAAPDQAARVIAFNDHRIDALLWDITTTAGEEVTELRGGIDGAFAPVRELGISAIATSNNIIGDVIVNELTESQSRSLFITVAVAGLVLIVNFLIESRRWFLGVITIAPVALVVMWTYGLMALTGVPFGPVTATLAALAIGIGVPYTIHITRRFLEDRKAYPDGDEAMRSTMRHTGGALAGSALTTVAGFGVLVTSSLLPFRQMGQVTAYAVGLSLVAAVAVLPSMLSLWDRYHRRAAARQGASG